MEIENRALARKLKNFGVKLLPDSKNHVMRIEIRASSSKHKYVVSKRNSKLKRWECSCPGWVFHQAKKCKHIKAISPILEIVLQIPHVEPKRLTGR